MRAGSQRNHALIGMLSKLLIRPGGCLLSLTEQAKTWLMEKAEQQINLSGKLRNASRLSKASTRGYVFETSKVKERRDASASPVWLITVV